MNAEREGKTRIFLGGTSVQSSRTFLGDLMASNDAYY